MHISLLQAMIAGHCTAPLAPAHLLPLPLLAGQDALQHLLLRSLHGCDKSQRTHLLKRQRSLGCQTLVSGENKTFTHLRPAGSGSHPAYLALPCLALPSAPFRGRPRARRRLPAARPGPSRGAGLPAWRLCTWGSTSLRWAAPRWTGPGRPGGRSAGTCRTAAAASCPRGPPAAVIRGQGGSR